MDEQTLREFHAKRVKLTPICGELAGNLFGYRSERPVEEIVGRRLVRPRLIRAWSVAVRWAFQEVTNAFHGAG